jgi:MscS family membrane protein
MIERRSHRAIPAQCAVAELVSKLLLPLLLVLALPLSAEEAAQENDARQAQTEQPEIPVDKFDRGTPKQSGDGFMRAIDLSDYETAAEYLDLRNIRGAAAAMTGMQLARRLEVIIQRAEWVDIADLVDRPEGRRNDGLPDYRDLIGRVLHRGNEVQLLMQRVPRGDGEFIWKISNATVSQIPALYESYGYPDAIEELRRFLPKLTILGFALFKWVTMVAVGAAIYGLVFLSALIIRRVTGDTDLPSHQRVFRFLIVPFGIWAAILAMNTTATSLGRGVTAEAIGRASPIPVLITLWVMFAAINLFRDLYAKRLRETGRVGGEVLIRPAGNAMKLIIAIAAILVYLDQIGINITTVLAGLGVGGIAVALALQKPMEDIFGAITLYSQQPVRVGDFCRFGEITGTIEEIGLRTTRVRTLANTLMAVPNSKLSNESIENISARKKILYWPRLRLNYDTPPEQIRMLLENLRKLLREHDRVLQDTCRVRFVEIADDSLQIEIFVHLDTTVWVEFLELTEELNLRFLEAVADAGTRLALPASAVRIEQSDGIG